MSHVGLLSSACQTGAVKQPSDWTSDSARFLSNLMVHRQVPPTPPPSCYSPARGESKRTKEARRSFVSKRRQRMSSCCIGEDREGPLWGETKKKKDLLQNKPSCAPKNLAQSFRPGDGSSVKSWRRRPGSCSPLCSAAFGFIFPIQLNSLLF